jgi:hypothetical protein
MFPSECVLERRVHSGGAGDDNNRPLFILECKDRKADGYADDKIEIYNQRIQGMNIGLRLADKPPPAVSYLAILGGQRSIAKIVTVDKTVIVIRLMFSGDGGRMSYLIYDAVALSLHMIPMPEDPSWNYTLTSSVSIARSRGSNRNGDDDYALVLTGLLCLDGVDTGDCLSLWRPSSSSPPWLERKEVNFPALVVNDTDTLFSFSGSAYWVDLLRGVSYCSCDALFDDDDTGLVEFGFIPLPIEGGAHHRSKGRVAQPVAYRTMGVVGESIIRFVSIDGFQSHVKRKNRTVTVWKLLLLDHDLLDDDEHC